MPYRCSIPNCKGNYSKQNRVRVFSFPNDPELKKAWEKVIPRKDFGYTKNSKICEKHFNNDDIRWESSAFDERSNKTITVTLERPRLKPGAIPSVFPEFSSYLAKEIPAIRESPNKKRLRLEQQHFAQAIAFSVMIQEQAEKNKNLANSLAKPVNDINEKSVIPSELYISETKIKQEKDEEILPSDKQVVPVIEALSVDERKRNFFDSNENSLIEEYYEAKSVDERKRNFFDPNENSLIEEYYEAKLEVLNKEYNAKLDAMKAEYEQKIKFLKKDHEYKVAFLKLKMEYKVSKCLK